MTSDYVALLTKEREGRTEGARERRREGEGRVASALALDIRVVVTGIVETRHTMPLFLPFSLACA